MVWVRLHSSSFAPINAFQFLHVNHKLVLQEDKLKIRRKNKSKQNKILLDESPSIHQPEAASAVSFSRRLLKTWLMSYSHILLPDVLLSLTLSVWLIDQLTLRTLLDLHLMAGFVKCLVMEGKILPNQFVFSWCQYIGWTVIILLCCNCKKYAL